MRQHFLGYETRERYDAVVNMGVTEHLPDYKSSLRKYGELLKPGGGVYLDALAMRTKHNVSTFMSRYIYPGGSSPLLLHEYLRQVAKSPFELIRVDDDRHNYHLTCKAWAERLDYLDFASPVPGLGSKMGIDATNKWPGETGRRWGEPMYRRFRLFLWGSAAGFDSGLVQAYRWVLRLPQAA